MRLKITAAVLGALALLAPLAPGFAYETTIAKAPFEIGTVCVKRPYGIDPQKFCYERVASAQAGVLAVGGPRLFSNPIPDNSDPLWTPHVYSASAGVVYRPPSAGSITVTAEVTGVQADDGQICLRADGSLTCQQSSPVTVVQAGAVTRLISHLPVYSSSAITIVVISEKKYDGVSVAFLRELWIQFTPASGDTTP